MVMEIWRSRDSYRRKSNDRMDAIIPSISGEIIAVFSYTVCWQLYRFHVSTLSERMFFVAGRTFDDRRAHNRSQKLQKDKLFLYGPVMGTSYFKKLQLEV